MQLSSPASPESAAQTSTGDGDPDGLVTFITPCASQAYRNQPFRNRLHPGTAVRHLRPADVLTAVNAK
jgi:hypothetical protein